MRKNREDTGQWAYLEGLGILENGTEEEIKEAKRTYRKLYLLRYKKKQREEKQEFSVLFSRRDGEYARIKLAAKRHLMTISAFVHAAVTAYLTNAYIVPDTAQIARLEQLLSSSLNEVKRITQTREKHGYEREQKLAEIEKAVSSVQDRINAIFRTPLQLEDLVRKAISNNQPLKERLLHLLSNDRKD